MRQKGFILFFVMIFLIIVSVLGISMFGGFIKNQMIAGNYREKDRAIDAAQAALDYSQNWLSANGNLYDGGWNTGVVCTANQAAITPVVCSNPVTSAVTEAWAATSNSYTPPSMTVNAGGGQNSYATNTNYYLQYAGITGANPPAALYKVTSTAQGGNANASTVLESVYQVQTVVKDTSAE